MPGLGTLANVCGIVIGGLLGLGCGRLLTKRLQDTLMMATAVAVIFIGIGGTLRQMLNITSEGLEMTGTMMMIASLAGGALIGELINLVRYSLNRELDSQSIHTARFITHIKFFVDRFFTDKLLQNDDDLLFEQIKTRYPKELGVALKIKSYLYDKYGRILPNEEVTFLVVHIARIARSQV